LDGQVEVEVKLRVPCDRLDELAAKVEAAGGRLDWEGLEVDVYYQHPCRDALANDEALRLRYHDDALVEATYKGPRVSKGDVKKRPEYNLPAGESLPRVLEILGFRPALRVAKYRRYYSLPDATVTIDRVEGLGCYVEIESKGRADPRLVAARIGLEGEPVEASYAELALKKATRGT